MRLVVVGGGVAGPALALAARQRGLDAVVLERRAVADPDEGSWITVSPNGLDALAVLGVLDEVRNIAVPTRTNRMFAATGARLGELSLGVPLDDGTVALTMKRSALAALLQEAARRAGLEIRLEADVVSTREEPDRVVAELAGGEAVCGDVLVGADGVHSRVRVSLDPTAPAARYVGLTNFGGMTPAAAAGDVAAHLEPEAWHFVFGRRCFFGAHPLPNGDVVWFVNVPRPEIDRTERARTTDDQWLQTLAALVDADRGPSSQLVSAGRLELAGDNTYDLPRVPTWRGCRTVLIGDAVHAPSPSSGQGAAMALEDAIVLATAMKTSGLEGIRAYESTRRTRVEKIVAAGARSSNAKVPGPAGRRVRDTMLRIVFRYVVTEKSTAWITGYRLPR